MMATSKKIMEQEPQEPSEIEMLLPWHAAGTLNARDARRVDEALARDPELAKQYAVIQEEYAETIHLNESLGAPSTRAMQKLFAAIDSEPARRTSGSPGMSISARIASFFASLSPRTLAWSASLGALALLLQAGVIGAVLMKDQPASFQTASLSTNEPITRGLGPEAPPPLEPARRTSGASGVSISARIAGFFSSLSPRTLVWSASLGALVLLLQAGVIGAVLMKGEPASFQTASLSTNEPITRALGPQAPPRALVRFAPDARVADITALLDNYHASIVDGAKGGLFRLQFGNKAMSKDQIAGLMSKLQNEKIVRLAVATP